MSAMDGYVPPPSTITVEVSDTTEDNRWARQAGETCTVRVTRDNWTTEFRLTEDAVDQAIETLTAWKAAQS